MIVENADDAEKKWSDLWQKERRIFGMWLHRDILG